MIVAAGWAFWLISLYLLCVLGGGGLLPLLLAVFVPLLLLGFAAVCIASRHFSVSFPTETSGSKKEPIEFYIRAENKSPFPLPRVSCRIGGVNLLTGEAFRQRVDFSVGANETRVVPCSLTSEYCGRLLLTVQQIRLFDYFGLLFLWKSGGQKVGVTVLPNTFSMELLAPICKSIPDDSDEYSTLRAGNDPTEIFQIRDYRPGDSIRQIHWKLTQKFDQLMTKEASLPVDQSVLVVFDTRQPAGRDMPPACYDAAAEVLVTLSQALLENGIVHRIAWRDAAAGNLELASVASTEDLTNVVGGILMRTVDDGVSTLDLYRMEHGTPEVSHVFAVCAAVPCVPDASFEIETTVLCGCEGEAPADSGVLYFGSETYSSDLAALIV
jgi:uncharacterized protein (DUF58 family)